MEESNKRILPNAQDSKSALQALDKGVVTDISKNTITNQPFAQTLLH
jgi:hypothetical protein